MEEPKKPRTDKTYGKWKDLKAKAFAQRAGKMKVVEPETPPAPGRFDEWIWSGDHGSKDSVVKFPCRTPKVAELMEALLVAAMKYADYIHIAETAFRENSKVGLPPHWELDLHVHLNEMRYAACKLYAFKDDE